MKTEKESIRIGYFYLINIVPLQLLTFSIQQNAQSNNP